MVYGLLRSLLSCLSLAQRGHGDKVEGTFQALGFEKFGAGTYRALACAVKRIVATGGLNHRTPQITRDPSPRRRPQAWLRTQGFWSFPCKGWPRCCRHAGRPNTCTARAEAFWSAFPGPSRATA